MNAQPPPAEIPRDQTGIIIVDHGSRRPESNALLLDIVAMFQEHTGEPIVEPAHMELAEPSIATAFDRCVQRGAGMVVVFPYFLLPGRHWDRDIPALTAEAAVKHPGIPFLVTAPFGQHPFMAEVMRQRIEWCLGRYRGDHAGCELCEFAEFEEDERGTAEGDRLLAPGCRLGKGSAAESPD